MFNQLAMPRSSDSIVIKVSFRSSWPCRVENVSWSEELHIRSTSEHCPRCRSWLRRFPLPPIIHCGVLLRAPVCSHRSFPTCQIVYLPKISHMCPYPGAEFDDNLRLPCLDESTSPLAHRASLLTSRKANGQRV